MFILIFIILHLFYTYLKNINDYQKRIDYNIYKMLKNCKHFFIDYNYIFEILFRKTT